MINYNNSEYRENENSEQENVVMNTILVRNINGKIVEIYVRDDIEEEG